MKLFVSTYPYIDSAQLFAHVADQDWAIFLDSGVIEQQRSTTKHADFDVLAIKPFTTLVTKDGKTKSHSEDSTSKQFLGDPIEVLKKSLPVIETDDMDMSVRQFAYLPGALGYFSYDLAREYENMPNIAIDDENLPQMAMGIYHAVVVIDHKMQQTYLLHIGEDNAVIELTEYWVALINRECKKPNETEGSSSLDQKNNKRLLSKQGFTENLNFEEYVSCFEKVRNYTVEGDCYQVNLAKRFTANVQGNAWSTYSYLRGLSPAPYGAYMNFPFAQVLSNSPESFIQCIGEKVITSPIKGTRARNHNNPVKDKEIAQELLNSEKDRAENLMIVDLMRNDLSRCCELSSVKVPHLFSLYSFANVHHLISTITGTLKKGMHSLDLLRSCFPGGSITGAPKIRAMEIIEELEPHRRGLYCGAIGYVGVNGDLQTNIAIRTIVIKDGVARYAAGGGLVIDSDLDEEYQEIIDKARMVRESLSK